MDQSANDGGRVNIDQATRDGSYDRLDFIRKQGRYATMKKKCGCYFDLVEDPASKGHTGILCPLHSSAQEMLALLKRVYIYHLQNADQQEIKEEIRNVIAKIGGTL